MRFLKCLAIAFFVVLFLDIQPTYGKGGRGGGSRGSGSRGSGSRGSSSGTRGRPSSPSPSSTSHGSSSSSSSAGKNPLEQSSSKNSGSQPQPVKPSAPELPKEKPSAPQLPQNPNQHQSGSSGTVSQVNPPSHGSSAPGNVPPHGINQGAPSQGNPPPYGTNQGYPSGNPPPYGANPGYPAGNPPPYGANQGYPSGNPPPYGANPGYPAGNPPPYGTNQGYPSGNPPPYGTNQGYPSGNPPPYGVNTGSNPQAPPPYGFNIPQGPASPSGGVNRPNIPHGSPPYGVNPGSGPHGYVPPPGINQGNLGPGGKPLYPRQPGMVYPPAGIGSPNYYGPSPVGGTGFVPHKKKGLLGGLFSLNKGKKPKYGGVGAYGASSLGGSRISPVNMMLPAMALGKSHKSSKFNKGFLMLPLLMFAFSRPRMHFHGFGNDYNGRCFSPREPGNGTIDCKYSHEGMACEARCLEGYVFSDNTTTKPAQCWHYSGYWRPSRYFSPCLASCGTDCKNGGTCKTPGVCRCLSGFRGNQCEYRVTECDIRKISRDPKKISWVCSHTHNETTCTVKCRPPGKFENPVPEKYHCHVNGTWTPNSIPECTEGGETQEGIQTSTSTISVVEDTSKDSTKDS